MKISGVVFDFGGVITVNRIPIELKKYAAEIGIDWDLFKRGFEKYRLEYDGGFISLGEMYERIFKDGAISVSDEVFRRCCEADSASWLSANPETKAFIKNLKERGFKIGILTNMAPVFADVHFKTAFADFIELADAMVISGHEKMVKPNREIYDLMQKRIALPPNELCFFDDVESNISAARAAGWNAIRCDTIPQIIADFEDLIK